jgi:hypothetical protein
VYVFRECPNCDEAGALAEEVAADYAHMAVRVTDLDELGGSPPPDPAVAAPAYVLNGRGMSLGNRCRRSYSPVCTRPASDNRRDPG